MLEMLEKKLTEEGIFSSDMPELIQCMVECVPSKTIPYRMKLAIVISEIATFVCQFQRNIQHWNGSLIPPNCITFCLAKSGAAKDSSMRAVRKCFKTGYDVIAEERIKIAKMLAIQQALQAGKKNPDNWNSYKEFYIAPNPVFAALSTAEGFIQHLNDSNELGLGAGSFQTQEVGSEMTSSPVITEMIRLVAELYDEGTKEVKILKDRSNQSKELKNMPCCALFMGSQDNILYEEHVKRKFHTEFTTKLSRRSCFIFADEPMEMDTFDSIEELLDAQLNKDANIEIIKGDILEYIRDLALNQIHSCGKVITVSDEVRNLHTIYQKYNELVAETIPLQFPMTKLTRLHLQWKAFKLSGAIALLHGEDCIFVEHYKAATAYLELISRDIQNFEKELVKEPYELFSGYCQNYSTNNEAFVGLHLLRKMGFIPMGGDPLKKVKELIQLVSSYDSSGTYTLTEENSQYKIGVLYKKLQESKTINVTYKEVSGSKADRAKQCSEGFVSEEIEFKDLSNMLTGDYAYTPFKFNGGKRNKDNLYGSCKWLVLDIDKGDITDDEAHLLLSDCNHYIVRTSNANNAFKFRLILELDVVTDIADNLWGKFLKLVSNEIGIDIDVLPKSQIFFSYANRRILSVLDAEPFPVRNLIIATMSNTVEKKVEPTKAEASNMLKDSLVTFEPAYYAKQGEGSRKLIWAARKAKELGATYEEVVALLEDIQSYWVMPMDRDRFEKSIIRQIKRWYNAE